MDTQSFSKTPSIIEVSVRPQETHVNLQLRSVGNQTSLEKKSIRDIFLDDNESFEDAEIFYPSKMNEESKPKLKDEVQTFLMPNSVISSVVEVVKENEPSPFIVANTEEVSLKHLQNDCIIPVFRDSEQTIAHFQLINTVQECYSKSISIS